MRLRTAMEIVIRSAERDMHGAGCGVHSIPSDKEKERIEQAIKRCQNYIWGIKPSESETGGNGVLEAGAVSQRSDICELDPSSPTTPSKTSHQKKATKHWCQENNEYISPTRTVCKICGNEWILGEGWKKPSPSRRGGGT